MPRATASAMAVQMEASNCPEETARLQRIASDAMTEILCIDHLFFTYHPDYYRCQESWVLQSPRSNIGRMDAMKRAAVSPSDFIATECHPRSDSATASCPCFAKYQENTAAVQLFLRGFKSCRRLQATASMCFEGKLSRFNVY